MGSEVSGLCSTGDVMYRREAGFGAAIDDFLLSRQCKDQSIVKILLVGNDKTVLGSIREMAESCGDGKVTADGTKPEAGVETEEGIIRFGYKHIDIVFVDLIGREISSTDLACFSSFNAIIFASEFSDRFKDSIRSFRDIASSFPSLGLMFWIRTPAAVTDSPAWSALASELSPRARGSSPLDSLSMFIHKTFRNHSAERDIHVHLLSLGKEERPKADDLLQTLVLDLGDMMLFNWEKSP